MLEWAQQRDKAIWISSELLLSSGAISHYLPKLQISLECTDDVHGEYRGKEVVSAFFEITQVLRC